jgi:hypothetical protein
MYEGEKSDHSVLCVNAESSLQLVQATPPSLRDSEANPSTTNQAIQSAIHQSLKQSPEFNLLQPHPKKPTQAALQKDSNINPPLRLLPSTNPRRGRTLRPRHSNPSPIAIAIVPSSSIATTPPILATLPFNPLQLQLRFSQAQSRCADVMLPRCGCCADAVGAVVAVVVVLDGRPIPSLGDFDAALGFCSGAGPGGGSVSRAGGWCCVL